METQEEKNWIDLIKEKVEWIDKFRKGIRGMLGDISHKFGDSKSYYKQKEWQCSKGFLFLRTVVFCHIKFYPVQWNPSPGTRYGGTDHADIC